MGFLELINPTISDLFNCGYAYDQYTVIGAADDATSLENMRQALYGILECNELRKAHGLQELKISNSLMAIAEYDTIDTAKEDATDAALTDIESLDQDIDDPGKMVLANGLTVSDYMAQTKLAREQTRGKNKEDLLAIIDSDAQTELDKQAAIDAVVRLTDYSDKENAVETLLSAKGFDNSIVSITQDAVDVVICKDNLLSLIHI